MVIRLIVSLNGHKAVNGYEKGAITMTPPNPDPTWCCCGRREFLLTMGAAVGGLAWLSRTAAAAEPLGEAAPRPKSTPTVRGAFLYPPSETLRKAGYWSWPGSTFDAEGRHKAYLEKILQMEKNLGMRIAMERQPLDKPAQVARFIEDVKESKSAFGEISPRGPDGLLLIPFKKGHWPHVLRIIEETKRPTVVLATLGVLLSDHIRSLHRRAGVYLISAADDLEAVADGMKMIRTACRMKDARIVNIAGGAVKEAVVPGLETQVRTIPHARFVELYRETPGDGPVRALADAYRKGAKAVVEPSEADILDAARTYFVFKRIIETEHADAIMMECLTGLRHPRTHCPPCMGFMSLRDEGIPAGCESDLSATLTLMLVQHLFDRPGFQHNESADTERNLYFGAHCVSASKMNGPAGPAEPYELRSHAEAGWGCVPRVLFPAGQELTIAQYRPGKTPRMLIYTGKVVECPPIPPTGGCRSNVVMTINERPDVCDVVAGRHNIIFYGNEAKRLRAFCQMYGIQAVS